MRPVSRSEWIGIIALCAAITLPPVILTPLFPPGWVMTIGFALIFTATLFLGRAILSRPG